MSNKIIEVLHKAGRGAVAIVPGGSIATEFWQTPYEKRRDNWFQSLEAALSGLGIDLEELTQREDFFDIVYNATRLALGTSNHEKLQALVNFVCNVAEKPDVDDAIDKILLTVLEDCSGTHIKILQKLLAAGLDGANHPNIRDVVDDYDSQKTRWDLLNDNMHKMGLLGPYGSRKDGRGSGLSDTALMLLDRINPPIGSEKS